MKVETKDYTGFSAQKLLNDDFFIWSHKEKTPETENFWKELLHSGQLAPKEYEEACFMLKFFNIRQQQIPSSQKEELWKRIVESNRRHKQKIRHIRISLFIAAAACLLVPLLLNKISVYHQDTIDKSLLRLSQTEVALQGDEIQLILPKQAITIEGTTSNICHDSKGHITVNSEQLQDPTSEEEGNYNQLIVPNGKRSTLAFEDGTRMWVNAGSRVIYPNKFKKERREIFVDGEVYMEVARDEERPFIVKTSTMNIRVLGTAFNVTAYKKDVQSSVVLASGSVSVKADTEEVKLVPNEMFSHNIHNGVHVEKVVVSDYTSWKDGIYIYHSEPLSSILNRISRYYGKEICYPPSIATFKCSGKLNLLEDLDSLLEGLTHTVPVNYKKTDEKYMLEERK
ncbi:FecR family protein [uncultured Bacteroides sp.]|uniref:FecR family protein n=1 Tax=uncultured Bacteroides sp. TaxID=162156 RepID=UPI00280B805E|nr:FecR family protein [uncultured Bacteroides sp.]